MAQDRIKKLCEYIDSNRGKNYPIYNEQLKTETDYIKNSYFKMLAVILQQGEEITDSQRNLFTRQIVGVSCDYSMADYLRQALEIEIEEYVNFTEQCREMPIRYRFILDALLLTSLQQNNEDQVKLVAYYADDLRIKKMEMEYIALLARNVLEQNISVYTVVRDNNIPNVPIEVLADCIDLTLQQYLYDNDQMAVIHGDFLNDIDFEKLFSILDGTTPIFKISNIEIDVSNFSLYFSGYRKVIFEHCVFNGGSSPVSFENCDSVEIKSCTFRDFTNRTLIENSVNKLRIENTTFEQCSYSYNRSTDDWKEMGCVIHSNESSCNGTNFLSKCKFVDCFGKNSSNYYTSAFISNCPSELRDCRFENCWHYNYDCNIDPEDYRRRMFTSNSSAIRCTTVNSANII